MATSGSCSHKQAVCPFFLSRLLFFLSVGFINSVMQVSHRLQRKTQERRGCVQDTQEQSRGCSSPPNLQVFIMQSHHFGLWQQQKRAANTKLIVSELNLQWNKILRMTQKCSVKFYTAVSSDSSDPVTEHSCWNHSTQHLQVLLIFWSVWENQMFFTRMKQMCSLFSTVELKIILPEAEETKDGAKTSVWPQTHHSSDNNELKRL